MSLQDQLDALNLLIPANDEVSEPFQPIPTWERWKTEDLMANREGTVIRSGLYLKDRKDIADALTAVNEDADEKIEDETTNRINADQDLNNRVIVLEKNAGGGGGGTADKLSTSRNLQVDLANPHSVGFDGSADATSIGVKNTLPITNGGTGRTDGKVSQL
ncbi:UNVERIFIED_CONTAM: hypothetical protein RF648_22145, partial [Kocuria sp. CPCC 205274]